MPKLHELLAAEKTVMTAREQLSKDVETKFAKHDNYFTGYTRTLKMLAGDPTTNRALEDSQRQDKALPTTVVETLAYFLKHWATAENLLATKNVTNTEAKASLEFRGQVLASDVPVDELLGLESRLVDLRKLMTQIPTLDASKDWEPDPNAAVRGSWRTRQDVVTSKTEKQTKPVVLYEATKEHPAQVKEVSTDVVVGTFTQKVVSGAATALQKAEVLTLIDELLVEVKKARTRANDVEVQPRKFGETIAQLLLSPFTPSVQASNQ